MFVAVPRVPPETIYTDTEPEPRWLIPEMLHEGSTVLLAGMPGVGKSLFGYWLGNSLATGSNFAGTISEAKRVLDFDEENSLDDLRAYSRWTWRGMKCPSRELLRENLRIESRTLSGSTKWGETMREIAAEHKPHIIILDTTTPACHIKDENDNAEASAATQKIRLAQDAGAAGCAAILFKHLRLDTTTGKVDIRGAKHWKGAVDAIWYHMLRPGPKRQDGWRNTVIRPEKSRAYGLRQDLQITPHSKDRLFVKLDLHLAKYAASQELKAQ